MNLASSGSSSSSASSTSATTSSDLSNNALLIARNFNFVVVPNKGEDPQEKYQAVDLLAQQSDALIRDIFGGGVIYCEKEKLGHVDMTEFEFREAFERHEELLYEPLREYFGKYWGAVVIAHSQLPSYVLPTVLKYAIHNNDKPVSISIDLPEDNEQSVSVVATSEADTQNGIYSRFVTRLERMKITDNTMMDRQTGKKKIIGYLDGPMETVHVLKEMQETMNGQQVSVWRYQLEKISSTNRQVIEMFEGKSFAEIELPAYAVYVKAGFAEVSNACNDYMNDLLRRFCVKLAEFNYSAEAGPLRRYSFLNNPGTQELLKAVPDLKAAVEAMLTNSNKATDAENVMKFAEWCEQRKTDQGFQQVLKSCAADQEGLLASAAQLALLVHARKTLDDTGQPMQQRLNNFVQILNQGRFVLRERPFTATKEFVKRVDDVLQRTATASLVKLISKSVDEKPNLFSAAIKSATSDAAPPAPSNKKNK